MKGLSNKRVVITGAASGIGRATAERFYEEGSRLCLIDIKGEKGLREAFPERMDFIKADVADEAGIALVKHDLDEHGLDVLINNAGITRDATIGKMEPADWDAVVAVNLTAVWRLCKLASVHMKAQGHGVILNAASVVAHYGNFGQTNYVATKAGVIGLSKTLCKELGKYGVRVNAVAPGFIKTPMVAEMPEKVIAAVAGKVPLGRMGEPKHIAATYAFLASDDGEYISGATINVDGGIILG